MISAHLFPDGFDQNAGQEVLRHLADSTEQQPWLLPSADMVFNKKIEVLQWLLRKHFVDKNQEDERDAGWWFSQMGRKHLRLSQRLVHPKKLPVYVLKRKPKLLQMNVFELLHSLEERRWVCRTKAPGLRTARKFKPGQDELQQPVDYTAGGPKVFWLKAKDKSFSGWYLKALLSAHHRPDQPLCHFLQGWRYEEIVRGKKRRRRGRGNRRAFSVRAADASDSDAGGEANIELERGGDETDQDMSYSARGSATDSSGGSSSSTSSSSSSSKSSSD